MAQYIDKATVMAEIERRISVLEVNESVISMLAGGMFVNEFKDLLSFLNTLEVKEVDLEKEIKDILNQYYYFPEEVIDTPTIIRITAGHFFELGLKAQKGE